MYKNNVEDELVVVNIECGRPCFLALENVQRDHDACHACFFFFYTH